MVAHLSWATWAIHSQSLISSERPEQFAHGCSFVLSDLSESLTVPHLIWAKWANERMSDEGMSDELMSEFPALSFSRAENCTLLYRGGFWVHWVKMVLQYMYECILTYINFLNWKPKQRQKTIVLANTLSLIIKFLFFKKRKNYHYFKSWNTLHIL